MDFWVFFQCSLFWWHILSYTFPKQLSKVVTSNFIFLSQYKITAGDFFHSFFSTWRLRKKLGHNFFKDLTPDDCWVFRSPHDFIVNPYNICLDGTEYEINTWEEMLNHAKISVKGEYPENPLGRIFVYQEACLSTSQTEGISYSLD